MSVPATLTAVLKAVPTPLDLTHVVVELDTDWPPTDTPVKVAIYTCRYVIRTVINLKLKPLQPYNPT